MGQVFKSLSAPRAVHLKCDAFLEPQTAGGFRAVCPEPPAVFPGAHLPYSITNQRKRLPLAADARHLSRRYIFKQNRATAMAEWHQLAA